MKKTIIAGALIAGLAVTTTSFAHWGNGRGGNGPGPGYGMMYNQMDPAAREKMSKFFKDTLELRKQMAVKQAEKMALLRADNPDAQALARLTGEIFDLRNALMTKAEEAGVTDLMGPGMMGGFGKRGGYHGYGMMGGQGRGGWNCPNW